MAAPGNWLSFDLKIMMNFRKKVIVTLIGICCTCGLINLLLPREQEVHDALPAIMFRLSSNHAERTNLTIDGQWFRQRILSTLLSFSGHIAVEALENTKRSDIWSLENLRFYENQKDILLGGYFYQVDSGVIAAGWLYTNKTHDIFILLIDSRDDNADDYVVVSPAKTVGEAYDIFDKFGLNYPYAFVDHTVAKQSNGS